MYILVGKRSSYKTGKERVSSYCRDPRVLQEAESRRMDSISKAENWRKAALGRMAVQK